MKDSSVLAGSNLDLLAVNEYPGRGLVVGKTKNGAYLVQVYWVMGRSEKSQNRILAELPGRRVSTLPLAGTTRDHSLLVYDAMREEEGRYIVGNGEQTETVVTALRSGGTVHGALRLHGYEPDEPHYTPRITAITTVTGNPQAEISVLHRSRFGTCHRFFYEYAELPRGFGYCVHTYRANAHPLPSFAGEPVLVPVYDTIVETADTYWRLLNEKHRVALVVKYIDSASGESFVHIRNKHIAPE